MLFQKVSDHLEKNAVLKKKKKAGPKSSQHPSAHRELCCLSMREVGDADLGTHSGWSLVLRAIISGLLKISCDIHTHTHTFEVFFLSARTLTLLFCPTHWLFYLSAFMN